MAARINRAHLDLCREKIKTSQLINRLQDNALAEKEFLTAGQIQCIKICLDKKLPNLQAVEHSGEVETVKNDVAIPRPQTYEEWLKYVEAASRATNGSGSNGRVH